MTWRRLLGRVRALLAGHPDRALALAGMVSLAAFLVTIPLPRVDGLLIGSDGVRYFMYVRSMVIDGDLDFENEFRHFYPDRSLDRLRTATGRVSNIYAAGSALLWAPFFLVAHVLAHAARALALPVAVDGYGYPYQAAVCLGSVVYGSVGLWLTYRAAALVAPRTALAAAGLVWTATGVPYYLVLEPSMAHMNSLCATALLLYVWLRNRPLADRPAALRVGLAGGLAGLVRLPDAAWLVAPALDTAAGPGPAGRRLRGLALLGLGFLLVFWVQMIVWDALYGSPVVSGYLVGGGPRFFWRSLALWRVLFSVDHGLFLWHPVLLVAAAGLVRVRRVDSRLALLLAVGLAIQVLVVAAWRQGRAGDAFGGRLLIGSIPALAVGLAAALGWLAARWPPRGLWAGGLALAAWNLLFMLQYRLGYIPKQGPYTVADLTVGKLALVRDLWRRLVAAVAA